MYQNSVYSGLMQNHALSIVYGHLWGINHIFGPTFYNIYHITAVKTKDGANTRPIVICASWDLIYEEPGTRRCPSLHFHCNPMAPYYPYIYGNEYIKQHLQNFTV